MANEFDISRGTSVTHAAFAGLASKYRIHFLHVPSGVTTNFAAVLTTFSDKWDQSWDEQDYFGRMDTVARFKSVKREITVSFACIADDGREAAEHMSRFQKLIKFLYPMYTVAEDQGVANQFQSSGVSTMAAAPLLGIRLCNLIQKPAGHAGGEWLLGYTNGFEFSPDDDAGWFLADGFNNGVAQRSKWEYAKEPDIIRRYKVMMPKKFEVSFTFKVLHTRPMGWSENGEWLGGETNDYPYSADDIAGTLPDIEPLFPRPTLPRWRDASVPKYVEKKGFLDWLEDVADSGL